MRTKRKQSLTKEGQPCYPVVKSENDSDSRPMSRRNLTFLKGQSALRPWSDDKAICAVCGEERKWLDDDLTCKECLDQVEDGIFRGTFVADLYEDEDD